jgi:hypothetical protein
MFLLVTGYDRSSPAATFGGVTSVRAVLDVQLGGAVLKMIENGANMVTVEPISEETFASFYQEEKGRWHGQSANKRRSK